MYRVIIIIRTFTFRSLYFFPIRIWVNNRFRLYLRAVIKIFFLRNVTFRNCLHFFFRVYSNCFLRIYYFSSILTTFEFNLIFVFLLFQVRTSNRRLRVSFFFHSQIILFTSSLNETITRDRCQRAKMHRIDGVLIRSRVIKLHINLLVKGKAIGAPFGHVRV